MGPTSVLLFDLAERRLAWTARRHETVAQNIANADTPGWRSKDLLPFEARSSVGSAIAPAQTQPNHLAGTRPKGAAPHVVAGERSPDGNSVALDVELSKIAETETTHSLVTGLYTKYLGMFRTAAGR